MDYMLEFQ